MCPNFTRTILTPALYPDKIVACKVFDQSRSGRAVCGGERKGIAVLGVCGYPADRIRRSGGCGAGYQVGDRRAGAKSVVIFDDTTGEPIEVDYRGTVEDVVRRAGPSGETGASGVLETPRGPGRPRLGVVAREVTLLPRHWEWLNSQPGGASVALRKLVEECDGRITTRIAFGKPAKRLTGS